VPKSEEKDIERYKARQAHRLELIRATIAFEHAALKPAFVLNGGAIAIVFAFLGAVWKQNQQIPEARLFVQALGFWGVGLFVSAIAWMLGYRSQFAFRKRLDRKMDAEHAEDRGDKDEANSKLAEAKQEGERGVRFRAWCEGLVILSLAMFLIGVLVCVTALTRSV
jgi:hypothetical protein